MDHLYCRVERHVAWYDTIFAEIDGYTGLQSLAKKLNIYTVLLKAGISSAKTQLDGTERDMA